MLAIALLSGGASLTASPAQADTGTSTTYRLAADRLMVNTNKGCCNGTSEFLVTVPRTLEAGQSIHLTGRIAATSSTATNVEEVAVVRCLDSSGKIVGDSSVTSRNHEGNDTTYYATAGLLPITANLLFTAPATGTYTCQLIGSANGDAGGNLTARAGSTWLAINDSPQPGAHWWRPQQNCDSAGTLSTCTYLGGSRGGTANPKTFRVFYDDATPRDIWSASPTATSIDAYGDVELTTCYVGTKSCQSLSGGQLARGTNAVVDTRLRLVQLDATNHTCATTTFPAAGAGSSPDGSATRTTIRDEAHHIKINHKITAAAFRTNCGTSTPKFLLWIDVTLVSGQPIKIESSYAQNTTVLTNGIAVNNF